MLLLLLYLSISIFLMERFFPGTLLNGLDVSLETVESAKERMESHAEAAPITLLGREGETELIAPEALGCVYDAGDQIGQLKRRQNGFLWPYFLFAPDEYHVPLEISFEESVFQAALKDLSCIQNQKAPRDAKVVFSDTGYQIQKETEGCTIRADVLEKALAEAIANGETQLDLEAAGCYEEPKIRSNSKEILHLSDKLGVWFGADIVYEIGEESLAIDAPQLQQWISLTEKDAVLKEEEILAFVDQMADTYDKETSKRVLYTTLQGRKVLTDKKHKWHIDREKEKEALLTCINTGGTIHREPYYLVPSGSRMGSELGDSYVEVDMTAQHLWVYRNGTVVVSTDVVTGHTGRGNGTPEIIGFIYGMQKNRVLRGENYASFVHFWAPFYKGYGLHDANWRGSFGGEIYKVDGSHGCVNIPPSVMPEVYKNIELGMPVITYY